MSFVIIQQFRHSLGQLDHILGKAEQWAAARKFPVDNLLSERLFPDMLPLVVQVRIACDAAKAGAARLSGREAPKHPDEEKTVAELRARIADVRQWLGTFSAADFEGRDPQRHLPIPFPPGKFMEAETFLVSRQIPNFYFHVVTTYALLRRAGVEIGKGDYLGEIPMFDS